MSAPPPRLGRTLSVLVLGDVAAKIMGICAYGLLGRRLGGTGAYGALEAALATVFVASLVVEGGLAPFGARAVAARPAEARRLLARIGLLRSLLAVVAAAGLGAYVLIARPEPLTAALIGWYALTLAPYAALTEWLFHGRNDPGPVVVPQALRNAALLFAAAFLVRDPETVWRAPAAEAAGFAAGALWQRARARRAVGPADFVGARAALAGFAAGIAPYFVSGVAFAARIFLPMAMAPRLLDPEEADAFGAAHRLLVSAHAVLVLHFVNLLPRWTRLAAADISLRPLYRSAGRSSALVTVALTAAACIASATSVGVETTATVLRFVYGDAMERAWTDACALGFVLAVVAGEAHLRFLFLAAGRPWLDAAVNLVGAATVVYWAACKQAPPVFALAAGAVTAAVAALGASTVLRRGGAVLGAARAGRPGEGAAAAGG